MILPIEISSVGNGLYVAIATDNGYVFAISHELEGFAEWCADHYDQESFRTRCSIGYSAVYFNPKQESMYIGSVY